MALVSGSLDSVAATHAFAAKLAQAASPGMLIGLRGPLGAGKTEFVKGFAAALGTGERVVSPTYVLQHIYPLLAMKRGIRELHHWDLYRLNDAFDASELLDVRSDVLTLVEWPERVSAALDLLCCEIRLDFSASFEDSGATTSTNRLLEMMIDQRSPWSEQLQAVAATIVSKDL